MATMVEIREAKAGMTVVDISGDITAGSEAALMDAYNGANDQGAKTILLNFSSLEYMNSGGIGLLVTVLVRANRQGQQILACGLNEHYRQIFELTRLDDAIGIFEDENAALQAVG